MLWKRIPTIPIQNNGLHQIMRKRQPTSPTEINNMYYSLSDIDAEPDNQSVNYPTRPFKKPKYTKQRNDNSPRNVNSTDKNTNKQLNFNKIKSGLTAIIEIWDTPIRDIVQALLKNELDNKDFGIRTKSPNRLIIMPASPESLTKIKKALDNNPNWYTYTPQKEKPKNLILKKVTDYNEIEVRTYIESLNLANVTVLKVIKYIYNKNTPDKFHFIVQITHDSTANTLMKTTNICYQSVKWGWFRRNKVFQCKRCQCVGHASINCHFPRRCVKCGLRHGKEDCPINANSDKTLLKCINYNQMGHPASYHGCEYLKYAQSRYDEQRNNNKKNLINKITNQAQYFRKINPNITFADISSNKQYPNLKSHHNRSTLNPTIPHNNIQTRNQPENRQNTNNVSEQMQELLITVKQQHSVLMSMIANSASKIQYLYDHLEL